MRLCGSFQQLRGTNERPEADAVARELVDAAVLAIDHADRDRDAQSLVAQRLDRRERRAARRGDVLDEAPRLALLEYALDPVRRPVLLRVLADDHERQPPCE